MTLSKGTNYMSQELLSLQQYLYDNGFLSIAPTGYFGNITEAAVKDFQAKNNLPQTGIVGRLTRQLINTLRGM
jgi:N-acetylmuramoyl-L-alanine amidase